MHLAAAGLRLGEDHLLAEPLQKLYSGLSDLRVERVGQAGDEQRYSHLLTDLGW
jgi:hypothetical protein